MESRSQICFRYETAHYLLCYPDALLNLPMPNLRTLFKFMLAHWDRYENEHAIRVTDETIANLTSETKAALERAQREYDTKYKSTRHLGNADKTKQAKVNEDVTRALKNAMRDQKRSEALVKLWRESREAYDG